MNTLIYDILGALLYGFAAWNLVLYAIVSLFKKEMFISIVISFIVCIAFTLAVGFLWYPLAFVLHVPAILVFFLYDLIKTRKAPSEKAQKGA